MRSVIVITGTPGTGKTTLARSLQKRVIGSELVEVNELVKKERLFKGHASDGAKLVDIRKLSGALQSLLKKTKAHTIILEGHLLCEVKIKEATAIVLRAHLKDVEKRLAKRGYKGGKLADNIVSEGLDYCGIKANENYPKVFEITGTKKQLLDASVAIIKGRRRKGETIELIHELRGARYKEYLL